MIRRIKPISTVRVQEQKILKDQIVPHCPRQNKQRDNDACQRHSPPTAATLRDVARGGETHPRNPRKQQRRKKQETLTQENAQAEHDSQQRPTPPRTLARETERHIKTRQHRKNVKRLRHQRRVKENQIRVAGSKRGGNKSRRVIKQTPSQTIDQPNAQRRNKNLNE